MQKLEIQTNLTNQALTLKPSSWYQLYFELWFCSGTCNDLSIINDSVSPRVCEHEHARLSPLRGREGVGGGRDQMEPGYQAQQEVRA